MHIDFDYFFAQCEEMRRPEIKNRPVAVCVFSGRTDDSGVVSTANYVARKYGVKSGMPIRAAKSKLAGVNDAILLPLDVPYYKQVSASAMDIIRSHADVFEHTGIDECYLDVSGTAGDFDNAGRMAGQIKEELKSQLRVFCSIGVAPNKMLAKVASDYVKPDGLTVVMPENAASFIGGLDVGRIPGIGPKTRDRLAELGITTAGQLAGYDLFKLMDEFGKKTGSYIHNAAKGIDDEPVVESAGERKQLMRIVTLKKDATAAGEMQNDLGEICRHVHETAVSKGLAFRTVGVILVLKDLENVARTRTLKTHTQSYKVLHSTAMSILGEIPITAGVRRLGVRIADLQDARGQGTLFDFMQQ
jgi:DNA polymerase IV (DinB-like DNA polymerase)